jgi:hypothetical protein
MKGQFWNIRSMGKQGRHQCIIDVIQQNDIEFIGIQETNKPEFLDSFLEGLIGRK